MSGRLRFLTNDVCPFAHRAWLALEEIGAEYEKVDVHIAPGTKEAHFTEAYRASLGANVNADGTLSDGKVPVIDDGGFLMCESVPVAYYLAETRGGGLVPADARDRAAVTIFNDQVGAPVMQKFYPFLMAKTDEAEAKGKADFVAALLALSRALGRRGGPYALGASLSLADVLVWPFIARTVTVLGHYKDFSLGELEGAEFAPLHAWVAAMRARPAVARTTAPDELLIDGYKTYATKKGAATAAA